MWQTVKEIRRHDSRGGKTMKFALEDTSAYVVVRQEPRRPKREYDVVAPEMGGTV